MIKTKPLGQCETWGELWAAHDKELGKEIIDRKFWKKAKRKCLFHRAEEVVMRDRQIQRLSNSIGEIETKKILEYIVESREKK